LGLPLLWLGWCRHGLGLVRRPGPWLVLLGVVAATVLWYAHAHGLYRKVGFKESNFPERIMEVARPNIYGDNNTRC
ncbi:MAG: hypothetical protein EBZ77_10970, partial [Chitinophagia bacterium]|nr:hypothetical protein [Chitinophagia bacterium]